MSVKILNFDLRHPPQFRPTGAEIYAAALEMCAWADAHAFQRVGIPEHHQNDDGYISCPLTFAAAVGGCTRQIRVRTGIVIAPLYDRLRLAEEVAVADLCLRGRLELGMGLGVLRADYEAFGVDFSRRGQIMEELIPFLRRAWTGEPFPYNGTTARVMPRPVQDPLPIFLGGMTQAATDRAARLADGFHTVVPQTWERYRESCRKFGKADPGPTARGVGAASQVRRGTCIRNDRHRGRSGCTARTCTRRGGDTARHEHGARYVQPVRHGSGRRGQANDGHADRAGACGRSQRSM